MFKPLGDSAMLVELGAQIDPQVNRQVHALDFLLQNVNGIIETVPAYCTLTIYYDALHFSFQQIKAVTEEKLQQISEMKRESGRRLEVPVRYGDAANSDIGAVALANNISIAEVIQIHSEKEYRVYLMGFMPGFPYLGILDERLQMPRLPTPRTSIRAGSVAIAGLQTGIYPFASPGGWQIIGWTALKLFDPNSPTPFLFAPNDTVKFIPLADADA
ncbi:MAG: 5-oxoprolinase subunit PxpB [Anaerolineales bacterium]|nr:5-oxoprolinase subunit PxpB [Anaerolineales bacterium]MCZ2120994.1 5-oxoprolinase subunit PxpB [Anaerolineales bacterium]